tara:strand:- start:1448 stop:1666 length:219 start_codon:yes stop_codon:yes gene_type:complete
MSAKAPAPAPIMRAPAQVASRMDDVVEKPIELVTADKDVKKKKKIASKSGTSALQTGMNTATGSTNSGVSYS